MRKKYLNPFTTEECLKDGKPVMQVYYPGGDGTLYLTSSPAVLIPEGD